MDAMLFNPSKMTILVVDDHDLIRKSVIKILTKLRFGNIIECSNGSDAIRTIATESLDLLICDLYLGSIDGFTVMQALRQKETHSDIPILIITGEGTKDEIVKAADQGVDDYILKPFQAPEFEKKVVAALNKFYSPTPLVSHLREAERMLLDGKTAEAQTEIELALKEDPRSARASHLLSLLLIKQGKEREAIENLRAGIDENPSFLKNYRTLADLHISNQRPQEAIKVMRSELELNPKQPLRQVQLAKLLAKSGDQLGAIDHYRQALLESNKLKPALLGIGKAFAESDNLEKAVYYFKRVRRHYPTDVNPLEALVKYALAAGQPKVAEMALRDEKKENPHRLDTYLILAKFYGATGRFEDGISVVEDAEKIAPESLDTLILKANLYKENNNLDEAQKILEHVVGQRQDINCYLTLCDVYLLKGELSQALQILHTALRTGKDTPKVFLRIADITPKTKQFTKSCYILLRMIQLGRNDAKILKQLEQMMREVNNRRQQVNTPIAS